MTVSLIYKITVQGSPLFYIGSTTQTLKQRLLSHKRTALIGKTSKFYNFVREKGVDCLLIEEIHRVYNTSLILLRQIEGHFIRHYQATSIGLNTNIAGRTHSEWQQENLMKTRAYSKACYHKKQSLK